MQKVYLLLRSNQQTGPFSLEELLQFDLKPYDLIWIEGRSAGWYYPQEIPALQPHLSFLKQIPATSTPAPAQESIVKPSQPAGPKSIFVSMPSNTIKEEPTPKPSLSTQPESSTFQPSFATVKEEAETLRTTYAKSIDEVETDYMNWVYQKRSKKKAVVSLKGIFVACLLVCVAFASWKLLQPSNENPGKTAPGQTAFVPVQSELSANSAEEKTLLPQKDKPSVNKQQKQAKVGAGRDRKVVSLKQDAVTFKQPVEVFTSSKETKDDVTPGVKEESAPVTTEEQKPQVIIAEAPKEKKKLRDKIADLFRKKPEEKKEEQKPVEEENGERRSVRREAGSNLAQMVTVKFSIPNDWMMGIKGAKATLTNRSSDVIARAVVEVVYYNDDNDVLDKRTISFSKIKSKQTQTMAVPDHQTATRLEYNVVSATGANEPFAKM